MRFQEHEHKSFSVQWRDESRKLRDSETIHGIRESRSDLPNELQGVGGSFEAGQNHWLVGLV